MIYYSKVIKASNLSVSDKVKIIKQPIIPSVLEKKTAADAKGNTGMESEMLLEAKLKAKEIITEAEEKARVLERETEEKIQGWWAENEDRLETLAYEAKEQGFEEGFRIGREQAKEQIEQEFQEKIEQMRQLLESAYQQKEAIISEAEPFLLELSTAISEQIIKHELETHPDTFLELIKQHILRFKEKEFITICVHPDDFDFIQGQRAHLTAVVNGETEIKVIPDHSVTPKGCIIRTAYGSVDARIDTQIEEIKKVILDARREPESDFVS